MTNPFNLKSRPVPILVPLAKGNFWRRAGARFERLPPAVAPVVVTLIGGLAIVLLFGAMMGREVPEHGVPDLASIENELAVPEANASPLADTGTGVERAMIEPVAASVAEEQPSIEAANGEAIAQPLSDGTNQNPAWAIDRDGSTATAAADNQPEPVAVAETVDETLALEEIQRREVEADVGPPSTEITAAIPPASGPKVAAIATKWVNMRAGPSDDAKILMVVPALALIEAESDCGWCAVSYDGRYGYIYKAFISYE